MKQRRLFLLWISVLLATSPAWAQGEADLVFRSGWGSFTNVQQDVWSQWSVKISNQGDQSRVARVGCLSDQADGGKTTFTREIPLPPYSSRSANLAFRPGVPKISPGKGRGAEQSYLLWDARTGQQIQAGTGVLTYASPGISLFGVLQAGRIEHDEISYVKSESLNRLLGDIQVTAGTRANFPDVWYGFSPLKYLALGGVDPSMFRATQFDAVLRWVRGGGCLLLLGGEALPDLLAGPLGQAAGVRGVGAHTVDTLHVQDLSKAPDKTMSVTLPWPLPMAELYAVDADVLYESDGLPLLTLRRVGDGCIITSAVPAGALKPRDEFNVWADVARARAVKPVIDDDAFLAPGRETLQQIAGRRGPDRLVPTTILAILLGIALLLGSVLRFVRRGEWLWILLVPLGLIVGVGLYYYSLQLGDPQRLSNVGVITGLGDGQARLQQTFAYYSGPDAQTIRAASGSPAGLITSLSRSTAAAMMVSEIRTTGDGTELPDQRIEPNGTRALYTRTIESLPVLAGTFRFDETGLAGELTNTLSADVEDAVLMVNFHTYRVGTIPAGQTRTIQITDDDLLGLVTFPMPKASSPRPGLRGRPGTTPAPVASEPLAAEGEFSSAIVPDKRQIALVRHLIAQPGFQAESNNGGARLIGYTTAAGVDPLSGRDCQRQGWSIINWPIAPTTPASGRRVFIPAGWVEMNYRAMNWDARHHCFIEVTRDAKVAFTAGAPRSVRLKNVTAEVVIDVRAGDYRLNLLGVLPGKEQKTVSLGTFDRPNGVVRLSVPDADRFLDDQGRVSLQLDAVRATMDLPNLGGVKPVSAGVAGAPWQIQRVDVSLKGTVR